MANAIEGSYFEKYKVKRRDTIEYLIIEPEYLKIHYEEIPARTRGVEIERIAPKIIRGVIEDIYIKYHLDFWETLEKNNFRK